MLKALRAIVILYWVVMSLTLCARPWTSTETSLVTFFSNQNFSRIVLCRIFFLDLFISVKILEMENFDIFYRISLSDILTSCRFLNRFYIFLIEFFLRKRFSCKDVQYNYSLKNLSIVKIIFRQNFFIFWLC